MNKVKLTMGEVELEIELFDTPTAQAIYHAAPFNSKAQTWGDEVYFEIPVRSERESDAKEVLDEGEIGFWLAGNCIAIPYGPTPVSHGDELRLASSANIWGRAVGDVKTCRNVRPGSDVSVEQA